MAAGCRDELCDRRSGRRNEAAASYRRALALATNPVEQAFFERRLAEVG